MATHVSPQSSSSPSTFPSLYSLGPLVNSTQQDDQLNGREQAKAHVPPVLVAVRCRPREYKSQVGRVDEVSRDSSENTSEDDCGRSHLVQRGILKFAAYREYDDAAAYDAALPAPRLPRPRRLHVQTRTNRSCFDFDYVFPPWTTQDEVYKTSVYAQVCHVLESCQAGKVQHATVIAYGQTGTGKTYTMGMLSDFHDERQRGLIPRTLSQVLAFAASTPRTRVALSFLQIYLETVQDLLVPVSGNARRDLPVRQRPDGKFYAAGLRYVTISSFTEAYELLDMARRNRVLAATARNKTSSRSHTLLTLTLERDDSAWTISFVDLAGSERVNSALHFLRARRVQQELRIRETKFINRSLSSLGTVMVALAGRRHVKDDYIRFRDSQLTKLLQSRLGDAGRLLLLATVDDEPKNVTETLSTLKFAAQCRRVRLERVIDRVRARACLEMKVKLEEREAALHHEYQTKIEALMHELESVRVEKETMEEASYTALCSLVEDCHPRMTEFRSDEEREAYVAGLYKRLRNVLDYQDKVRETRGKQNEQTKQQVRQLSPAHEIEFRAVVRHLITTGALNSIVVSSSDEDV